MVDKRELIRQSALEVFYEKGYHSSKIQDIAERTNIGVGSIYTYFKGKEEILYYIYDLEYEILNGYLDELMQMNIDSISKIKLFILFSLEDFYNNKGIANLMNYGSSCFTEYCNIIDELYNKTIEKLCSIIKEGQDTAQIRNFDTYAFAHLIFDMVLGFGGNISYKYCKVKYKIIREQFISFVADCLKNPF